MTDHQEQPFEPVHLVEPDQDDAARSAVSRVSPPAPVPGAPDAPPLTTLSQAQVFSEEAMIVAARRARTEGAERPDDIAPRSADNTFGIALSGGGIRSATISLGILRSLGRAALIPRIDYISSVSGGGYIAAFLCSRYVPAEWRGDMEFGKELSCQGGTGDPFAGDDGEAGLNHLRQNGRHLLPGGAGDALRLVIVMVRSWLAIHMVIGITLVSLLLLLKVPQIVWDHWLVDLETHWADAPSLFWPSAWTHGYPISHWFVGSWLLPLSLAPSLIALALFWSYFLTRGQPNPEHGRWRRAIGSPGLQGATIVLIMALGLCLVGEFVTALKPRYPVAIVGAALLAGFAAVTITAYMLAEWCEDVASREQSPTGPGISGGIASARVQEDRVRRRLTRWSTNLMQVALAIAILGLLDSIAQTLYVRREEITYSLVAPAILTVAVPLLRQLIMRIPHDGATGSFGRVLARFGRLLALVIGLALAMIVGLFWAVLAHHMTWFGGPIGEFGGSFWFTPQTSFAVTLAAAGVATAFVAVSYSFLNLSTFANFYASNLRRAYLGASNTRRWRPEPADTSSASTAAASASARTWSANRDHVDDDVALERYYDRRIDAPIHLINVTINDTASGSSNITQRDRRGKPLTLSPVGYLYAGDGARAELRHIPFTDDARKHPPDKLPLSTWIGISGAAASTGMGQYGSLGLSLVAGLANLRLGYWWNPGELPDGKRTDRIGTVQGRLKDELIGRFPGSDGSRWYLTDGGHFENTGAYELIRRRVALILVCDNGADPTYAFTDLVTLIRRVRIDFDAELRFEDDPTVLDGYFGKDTPIRQAFGTIADLKEDKTKAKEEKQEGAGKPCFGPYAALGTVTYGDHSPTGIHPRATSTVIWIKPRICGREALDLVAYAQSNQPFPQQSTLDQNYSEAQWESYFSLGVMMADRLFAESAVGNWRPRDLTPRP